MAPFFTSDTHFGDHRTLNLHGRPFGSTAEMDAALIANWNAAVGVDDTVWHLGDFARRARDIPSLLAALHGTKHLVRGNNDPVESSPEDGWATIQNYAELRVDEILVVMCHYPFRSWKDQHRRAVNLHGHSHGKMKPLPRQFDVGVDAHRFRPVTLAELVAARLKPSEPQLRP